MGRSYPLGSRRSDLPGMKKRERDGLMSESRWAWVRNVIGQFVILVNPTEGKPEDLTIRLFHPIPNRPSMDWNLTAMTEQELLLFKELIDLAFEWALPVVRNRDKEAADAFAEGDDSHARVYRQVPQLVIRKRPESEYREGVSKRSGIIPGLTGGAIDPDEQLRGSGDVLSELDPEDSSPSDNGTEADGLS